MTADVYVFRCKMCGECCKGEGGIIVSPNDLLHLASFLHLPPTQVQTLYCRQIRGKLQLRTGEDGFCIFFQQGKGCTVHAGKPKICKAWPFFRGNLEDPISFALAKDFCPGLEKSAPHDHFVRAGKAYLQHEDLLEDDPSCQANALIFK